MIVTVNPDANQQKRQIPENISQAEVLRISNKNCMYQLKYGRQFKTMLEPRDQVLEHQFDLLIPLTNIEYSSECASFIKSQDYRNIVQKIKQFVVEATSNVTSAAFNFLCREQLTDHEAKEYAAKNIMLNVYSIFNQTVNSIERHPFLAKSIAKEQLKQIRYQLAIEADYMLNTVLVNLADNYPQAPASGGTPRMREAILDIRRVEEQQNDHLFANGIKIQQFIDESAEGQRDYTRFIMQVINNAIYAVNSTHSSREQRSTFEKFAQFCERLFPLVQQEGYRSFIGALSDKQNLKESKFRERIKEMDAKSKIQSQKTKLVKEEVEKSIVQYFHMILQCSEESFEVVPEEQQNKETQKAERPFELELMKVKFEFQKMLSEAEKGAEALKRQKRYAFCQKIPAFVKEFNRQEIESKHFEAKHSSILRIMTKWAENLQQILDNPEKTVYNRPYAFKTTDNQLVHLRQIAINGAPKLVRRLHEERAKVQVEYKVLLQNCYKFIGDILSQTNEGKGNVNRYASTRTVASKVNAVLTFLMLQYLNLLIHHLLEAGREVETDYGDQNINLVVFRVADLLRSKFQCTETQFISLLKTLYVLDGSEAMKGKFKLVRIKNKLDEPSNNIIINYLFLGRVQCELQLSIHESKGKEKSYYAFSHFIYELIRGRFGAMAECAIMISQLDPMIISSRGIYYEEKFTPLGPLKSLLQAELQPSSQQGLSERQVHQAEEMIQQSEEEMQKHGVNFQKSVFNCCKCKRLVVNQSARIFQQTKESICNACRMKSKSCQRHLRSSRLRKFILEALKEEWLMKLSSFQGIKNKMQEQLQAEYQEIAIINDRGQLGLYLVIYVQEQLKNLLVRVDSDILNRCSSPQFDFSSLDVVDLVKLVKRQKQKVTNDLIYFINDLDKVKAFLQIQNEQLSPKLKNFTEVFVDFRLEKTIIKSIKAKSQIFNANLKPPKIDKLGQVIQIMEKSADREKGQVHSLLKYKKHKELDFSTIKELHAESIGLTDCPHWLPKLNNLKTLNLAMNRIEDIRDQDLPKELTHLFVYSNPLKTISIKTLQSISQLYLFNNQLFQIDLSHEFPNLSVLYLYGNQLTCIDFKHSLPSLSMLRMQDNQLRSINLSYNFPSLKQLSFYNNHQLQEIVFSKLFSLSNLQADGQVIVNIDFSLLPNLQTLTIYNGTVSREELKNLPSYVQLCHHSAQ